MMTPDEAREQARARWGERGIVGEFRCWYEVDGQPVSDATCYVGVINPEQSRLDDRGRGATFEEAFENADRRG